MGTCLGYNILVSSWLHGLGKGDESKLSYSQLLTSQCSHSRKLRIGFRFRPLGLDCGARVPSTWSVSPPSYSFRMEHSEEVTSRRNYFSLSATLEDSSPTCSDSSVETTSALELFEKNLLIVGPGVLGRLVASIWAKEFPGCKIVGQTRTDANHSELEQLGIQPISREGGKNNDSPAAQFPFVLFCAPPYGNDDYAGEVRAAAEKWNGVGSLLFTSSSAMYNVNDNGWCDENAPVIPRGVSPRVDRLLSAEEAVLDVGGNVVRLAGLYTLERGPHTYWLKQGSVDLRPDHFLNLIHYEDAASLCVAILKARTRKNIFMGCDNHPVSRQEIMDLFTESQKSKDKFQGFTSKEGPLGKRMCNDATRATLNWHPKYKSFAAFLEQSK